MATVAASTASGPPAICRPQAKGRAPGEPQVPGPFGSLPRPYQVQSRKGRAGMLPSSARQADGGDGLRGDALAAAGEAELFGGGRLHADAVGVDAEDAGDARLHRRAMRPDLRRLADDGDVAMG